MVFSIRGLNIELVSVSVDQSCAFDSVSVLGCGSEPKRIGSWQRRQSVGLGHPSQHALWVVHWPQLLMHPKINEPVLLFLPDS